MSEKKIITQFIQLYRDFPCLWDNREILYASKEARDQAYEVLLETYKQIQEDATIVDVKRKIEHLRCCYRREHRKVLQSRLYDDGEEHVPSLWYYDHMTFLNDVCSFPNLIQTPRVQRNERTMKLEYETPMGIARKKRKSNKISTIYLPDQNDTYDEDEQKNSDDDRLDEEDSTGLQDSEVIIHAASSSTGKVSSATEVFGTAIGLQLNDLDKTQKTIAEKLISEVIFHARLNNLTVTASINTS